MDEVEETNWLPECKAEVMGDTVSSLLFQPPSPTKLKEEKVVWLKTANGSRIPAFFIQYTIEGGVGQAKSLTRDDVYNAKVDGVTLLYSHANAEDLGSIYPWCKFLSKMLRVNLLAYDYTGYGMAYGEGPPTEEDCFADIDAAYKFLRYNLNIPASNIVLYGRSLGSGPSCYLASGTASKKREDSREGPVGGLILHAPFLSVYRIVIDTGCTVYGDKFPNVDFAPMIQSPVLLIHGTNDQIVPFSHSETLYKTLPESSRASPLYIEGMGHNNVHSVVRPLFVEHLNDYLDEHVRNNGKGKNNKGKRSQSMSYSEKNQQQANNTRVSLSSY
mmetsp:Transcript_8521/g.12164  ORF Transcript_8521/g.12164 Transcript_8521/m.12164 type:complete len:330 (-) Transcript_8521:124-1113(-)